MPLSLSFVLIHVVFSTRDRLPLIKEETQPGLHGYLATVTRDLGCECFRVGGVEDHVHLAIRLPRTVDISTLVEKLKANSSRWMKPHSPLFAWQRGYGVFSVSPSDRDSLTHYIDGQKQHHAKYSFQDELLGFLRKYGIEYDEKYLWD